MRNYFLDHVWRLISLLSESLYWWRQIFKKISNLFLNGFSGIWAQIWRFNKAFFLLFKKVFKIFLKNNFFIRIVYYVKFDWDFKKFDIFEYKRNFAYMQLWSTMHWMTKNSIFSIWNILAIFNFCLDIKGSFCREFKYLQYLPSFCRNI